MWLQNKMNAVAGFWSSPEEKHTYNSYIQFSDGDQKPFTVWCMGSHVIFCFFLFNYFLKDSVVVI